MNKFFLCICFFTILSFGWGDYLGMVMGIAKLQCHGVITGFVCCAFCLRGFQDNIYTTVKLQRHQKPERNECRTEEDPNIPESNGLSWYKRKRDCTVKDISKGISNVSWQVLIRWLNCLSWTRLQKCADNLQF